MKIDAIQPVLSAPARAAATELKLTEAQETTPAASPAASLRSQTGSWEANQVARSGLFLLGLGALVWGVFYLVWRLAPEVTPGSIRVYDAKIAALRKPRLFAPAAKHKVLVVGLSYTMTGFKPQSFDRLSQNTCSSFNLGLPVTIFGRHVYSLSEIMATLDSSGEYPTEVLITWREPWPPQQIAPKISLWSRLTPKFDNAAVVQLLFPFRQLARDGAVFLLRSAKNGGPLAFARACNEELQTVLENKGYYFIKTDSIYPNDQLPDNYSAASDSPGRALDRSVVAWEDYARYLRQTAPRARLILVPNYYRENCCLPAPSNAALRQALAKYGVTVVGPDYFQYPNRLFSDSAHLNPAGADVYTTDLWNLLQDRLRE